MLKIIEYFIRNKRLNYVLLLFVLFMGVNAYVSIPKELFPLVTLDRVTISGGYAGSSADNLDKMAVRDIEDALGSIDGIDKIETVIKPGSFAIVLTLQEGANENDALNKAKDAIAKSRQYLPSDMVEPVATLAVHNRPLVSLSLSSDTLTHGELVEAAKEIKTRFARYPNISEVVMYGDSDEEVSVRLDSKAIEALGLSRSAVTSAIANLSYIYPIGNIEQKGDFVFLSTVHGKPDVAAWETTMLGVGGKYVRLGEIARIVIEHPQDTTISTFNGRPNITLNLSKGDNGNAIALSRELVHFAKSLQGDYPQIHFDFYHDTSKPVQSRLETVLSNLMFGLILVFLSMALLINVRIASIVAMGIPFSFAIGIVFIYVLGYSINIVSLLGALIVIGIVVDDAIVVSENIQRHLNEGMERHAAVMTGLREMILPVSLATVTTVVAFLPLFMLSGEISKFIILIPIMVIMILMGSLIESFLFLPLHAEEVLRKQKNMVDWTRIQNGYETILHGLIRYKKSVLALFLITVPLLTFFTVKSMNFQFFPEHDGSFLYVTGKLDINTPIEETAEIARVIERRILAEGERFALKSVSTVTGSRVSMAGDAETGEHVFLVTMELYDMVPDNVFDRYLAPLLNFSFNYDDPEKRRTKHTYELVDDLEALVTPLRQQYVFEELGVREQRAGVVRIDVQVNFSGADEAKTVAAMEQVQSALEKVNGVVSVSNNLEPGMREIRLRVNDYGERLGLSEAEVARTLSAYFLDNRRAMTFNESGVMEIKTRALEKDRLSTLERFQYPLSDGTYVNLGDIVAFESRRDFNQIEKRDGTVVKTVFAKVNKRVTTPSQVLQQIAPVLDAVRKTGVKAELFGEQERNDQLASDMKRAVVVALFLMLITLLFVFPKIKYALIVMSVIPLSILGALVGHKLMGMNLTMPGVIGLLGLAGVVINDGIIMLDFLHGTHDTRAFYERAKMRLRPILITSITTFLGLFTLIFYATGQAVILQPIAVSIGFGLLWGTVLNLLYVPTLYAVINGIGPTTTSQASEQRHATI
ncbi:efflux RND transporter permease subunit [Sulfurimonas sp. HSL-3221]|uniref:efflux RND transporter permease subunit n=1 Tax=Sulfurimonadaceae TaxID=2771471 RepID=UPI001E3196EF|nr:efflux RND transporter permease subunit [Sulfurimonas sp. HSL-3221]UFS62627.1 efflux RND transporter permease subunit [Sulfurimonas sp. HSL-3221]